jgi:hypothetical protein
LRIIERADQVPHNFLAVRQCMTTVRLVTAKTSGSVWLMRRFRSGLTGVDRTGKTHPLPLKPHSEYTRAARTCAILPDGIRSAVRDPP